MNQDILENLDKNNEREMKSENTLKKNYSEKQMEQGA